MRVEATQFEQYCTGLNTHICTRLSYSYVYSSAEYKHVEQNLLSARELRLVSRFLKHVLAAFDIFLLVPSTDGRCVILQPMYCIYECFAVCTLVCTLYTCTCTVFPYVLNCITL